VWDKKRKLICVLLILFGFFISNCEVACASSDDESLHDFALWTPVYVTIPFGDKSYMTTEISPRWHENASKFRQLVVSTGYFYKLNSNATLMLAYAWLSTYIPETRNQHWIRNGIILQKKFSHLKDLTLYNRLLLEEVYSVFNENLSVRFRNKVGFTFPISKSGKTLINAFNEVFVDLYSLDPEPKAGISLTRTYIGVRRKINKNLSIEPAYQLQYRNIAGTSSDWFDHTLLINLFITI
jgi:hypothetical protein